MTDEHVAELAAIALLLSDAIAKLDLERQPYEPVAVIYTCTARVRELEQALTP